VLDEYGHSNSKNRSPADRPQKQKGNFLINDFDYMSAIYGSHLPE
jgi:hypothetical protein